MVGEKILTLMYKPHESKFRPSSAVAQTPPWLLMKFGTVEQVLPVIIVTVLTDNLSNTLYQIPNSVVLLFKKNYFSVHQCLKDLQKAPFLQSSHCPGKAAGV